MKRADTLAKIPPEWLLPPEIIRKGSEQTDLTESFIDDLLDENSRTITNRDAVENVLLLGTGNLSALEVVTAYCKRAAIAHQLNHNLLEIMFDSATAKARELDEYFRIHKRLVGPLHGLPFSMKDQWHVKGVDTTMAYVGWVGTQGGRQRSPPAKDLQSELVTDLIGLGAIPIAKTTLMQTLWYGETNNNILGYSWNPNMQSLSSGGSSGGEGALQAMKGSAFGFGTDVGGSTLMPAAANGMYALKPSHGRISFKDTANSSPGQMVIPTVAGIMGRSLRTLRLVFEALLSTEPWLRDPEVLPIPFQPTTWASNANFSFGMFHTDGIVTPHPPVVRAMNMVQSALQSSGHETVPWAPPSHREPASLHPSFTEADGAADVHERLALSGEPLVPEIKDEFSDSPPPIPVTEYYNLTRRLQDYRAKYASYWQSTRNLTSTRQPVDAIIMPVTPHAAPRPGKIFHYAYSSVINTLDYCSVVVPVTRADADLDPIQADYQPMNDDDRRTWESYEPKLYHGAPVGLQIVGGRLNEERLLHLAEVVVEALRKHS